ncbi:MAG: hypothetical protein V2A54_15770 [Bacteroidota bacterium]
MLPIIESVWILKQRDGRKTGTIDNCCSDGIGPVSFEEKEAMKTVMQKSVLFFGITLMTVWTEGVSRWNEVVVMKRMKIRNHPVVVGIRQKECSAVVFIHYNISCSYSFTNLRTARPCSACTLTK